MAERNQKVPFSDHKFTFGAFYLRFEKITDPATGKNYGLKSDIETLVTFKATAPVIDP